MEKNIKEYLPYIIIIFIVIMIRTFIITPVRVSGTSMNPNLKEGDILLLYKLSDINRYDIVVVDDSVEGDDLIKRVIAMPGETIEMIDGELYINDHKTADNYSSGLNIDFKRYKLSDDEYFVMGDNRTVSLDSRAFGPIKKETIKGKTILRLYPFNKYGKL